MTLDRRNFLIRQAGQRRPLPRDTYFVTDIDQDLVVELELFG
jgi:hypothetical protein